MSKVFILYLIFITVSVVMVSLMFVSIIETSGQITDKISIIDTEAKYIITTKHATYYTDKETFDRVEIGETYKIKAYILELE